MWPVTQGTVLGSGRVLPQKWPALFRMAQKAGFVNGRSLQQEVVIAIVRVVAVTAGHVAESQGMAAWFESIRAFFLMTIEAGLLLCQGIKYAVAF